MTSTTRPDAPGGDLEVPADQSALLSEMEELSPLAVASALVRQGMHDTRMLLERPRAQWFGPEGQCFVSRCGNIRDPLERFLAQRWGLALGCWGPAPTVTRQGRHAGRGGWGQPRQPQATVPEDALAAEAHAELGAMRGDQDARSERASAILRRFFAQAWERLGDGRAELLEEGRRALSDLAPEATLAAAVEDYARGLLRQRYPSLDATRVWQEHVLGGV